MGMTLKRESNRTYYQCQKGMFVRRVTKDTPGAVFRTSTAKGYEGQEIYEMFYENAVGYLLNVEFKKTDFGSQYEITLADGKAQYVLQFKKGYSESRTVLETLGSLHPDTEIKISPWYNSSSKRSGIIIEQMRNGEWTRVPNYYKVFEKQGDSWKLKELKHGYPSGDKVVWEDEDDIKAYYLAVDKFLHNQTKTWLDEKFKPAIMEQEKEKTEESDTYYMKGETKVPDDVDIEIVPNDESDMLPF